MNKSATIALSLTLMATGAAPVLAATAAPSGSTPPPRMKTAPAMQSERDSDLYTDALNYLEASGYTGITKISREGQGFDATAWHDGRPVSVMVDPSTHIIQPKG